MTRVVSGTGRCDKGITGPRRAATEPSREGAQRAAQARSRCEAGKGARPASAGPSAVGRCLDSVEPGDRGDALRGTRTAGLRSLRQSSRPWAAPGEATPHHPASTPHRARRQREWRAGSKAWQDYSASPERLSNRADSRAMTAQCQAASAAASSSMCRNTRATGSPSNARPCPAGQ